MFVCSTQLRNCDEPIQKAIQFSRKAKHTNLRFVLFDPLKNEHENFSYQSFPVFYLYKPKEMNPVIYDGKQEDNEILEFLKQNTGLEILFEEE